MQGQGQAGLARGEAPVHRSSFDRRCRDALVRRPLDVGTVIESGTYEVWRVEQPRQIDGLGHAWAKLIAV